MSVGFGFSFGDLVSGLKLIKDSVEAVHDTKGSTADYAALTHEIICILDGLEAVEEIQLEHEFSKKQSLALQRAVYSCQESIDHFLLSIASYQPHLNVQASGLKSTYRKIKWALCRKDDVAKFRAQLGRHASSINMLLITFQARQTVHSRSGGKSVALKVQSEEGRLADMLTGLSIEQRQLFMAMTQQNKRLMQSVEDLKAMLQFQVSIPSQVLLQQPVILLDPFGKLAPFHLEFVDSPECFLAVLKARFTKAGITPDGLSKLENQEFLIQDSQRKRPVDLSKSWASVFRPGQKVDMSMVFHRFACPPSTCPICFEVNEDDDEEIYCQSCGLCYQNVQAISKRSLDERFPSREVRIEGEEIPYILRQPGKEPEVKVFRPTEHGEDEIFEGYRRVQLVSQPLDLLDSKYPALQLIDDFSRFAELLDGISVDTSAHLADIRALHARAIAHLLQQRSNFPAFASYSQVEQVRLDLAQQSVDIRRDIDVLVQHLYNDPDTKTLMRYIKEKYPSDHGKDYYTGVLTRMANLSDFSKPNTAKVRSAERMQWLLMNGSPK